MTIFVAVSVVACTRGSSSAPASSDAGGERASGVAATLDSVGKADDRVVADGACWEVPSSDDDSRLVFVYRDDRLIRIEHRERGGEPQVRTSFEYDSAGRRSMERDFLSERVEEGRAVYTRDDAGRLEKMEMFSEDHLSVRSTMRYDEVGHLVAEFRHEVEIDRTYEHTYVWRPHGEGGWEVTFDSRMRDASGPWEESLSGRVVIDGHNRATRYEEMAEQNDWVWDDRGRCIASERRDKYGRLAITDDQKLRLEPGDALHEGVVVLEKPGSSVRLKREVDDRGNFLGVDRPEQHGTPRFEYDGDFQNMICGQGRWLEEPRTWRRCRLPDP